MRWTFAFLMATAVVLAAVVNVSAATLGTTRFAVGVFGGYDHPTGQADAAGGPTAGVRLRWGVWRHVEIEPSIGFVAHGDAASPSGAEIPAPSLLNTNLNALWKTRVWRLHLYLTGGAGLSRLDLHGDEGAGSDLTFNVGAGIEHRLGPVQLDLSPRYFVIGTTSGASRKHLSATLGVTYAFD